MLGKINFYHGLAISLLLHASLALPFLFSLWHIPEPDRSEKLNIELFGMVSTRQMQEMRAGNEVPRPTPQAAQAENKPVVKNDDQYRTVTTESPVKVGKEEEAVPVLAPANEGDRMERKQQRIQTYSMADLLRSYVAKVTRQIQGNLVFPKEVRENDVEAVSVIAFTITPSGNIREDSLRIKKSSGYSALDASALQSARASAPFEKPPMEIDIAIGVSFER
ncbi:energy transducer TonB [Sporomusa aerivorans]|uniref:energy transducer TonB n=1 Tax=Sporomusa aerivorans TaxID=204936 RepID=UPI00352B4662